MSRLRKSYPSLDLPHPSKTQSTVGTVLTIRTAPRQLKCICTFRMMPYLPLCAGVFLRPQPFCCTRTFFARAATAPSSTAARRSRKTWERRTRCCSDSQSGDLHIFKSQQECRRFCTFQGRTKVQKLTRAARSLLQGFPELSFVPARIWAKRQPKSTHVRLTSSGCFVRMLAFESGSFKPVGTDSEQNIILMDIVH